ncbi:MAG: hypothetical protein AAF670_16000, partial [Planctomycetota bacterium]
LTTRYPASIPAIRFSTQRVANSAGVGMTMVYFDLPSKKPSGLNPHPNFDQISMDNGGLLNPSSGVMIRKRHVGR